MPLLEIVLLGGGLATGSVLMVYHLMTDRARGRARDDWPVAAPTPVDVGYFALGRAPGRGTRDARLGPPTLPTLPTLPTPLDAWVDDDLRRALDTL